MVIVVSLLRAVTAIRIHDGNATGEQRGNLT
jgi:hypothetical protein